MFTCRPRGICLLINNVPSLAMEEKQLKDLFEYLSFDVQIRRGLKRGKMYKVAEEFAKKDHSHFDSFVVIVMSICGQDSEMCSVDGKNVSLEHIMSEFTATGCETLQGRPKLFFVQRFTKTSSKASDACSTTQPNSCCTDSDVEKFPSCSSSGNDSCPEEADFLLICVTSSCPADRADGVPQSLFIQVSMYVKAQNKFKVSLL